MAGSKQLGSRDLSLVRESGSTARVLNLTAVYHNNQNNPDYLEKPLFRNKRLNTSIIVKHSMRVFERSAFTHPPVTATKIIIPFAISDLKVGGSSFFYNQIDYKKTMKEALGGYNDPADFDADHALLVAIDALPSFDPFLMRERLRQSGFDAARCYFEVSEGDVGRMRDFVRKEVGRLVELAFAGGSGGNELSAKLADKLMTDETATSLDPLRATLRLSGEEYREGVFAWKGFLYYKWIFDDVKGRLDDLSRQIVSSRIINATKADLEYMNSARQRIVEFLGVASAHVQKALREYDVAFGRLADGKPVAFRDFLLAAPGMFIYIGEAIGVIQHIESFWRFRYPRTPAAIEADEAYEVFQDFEATLGGTQAVQEMVLRQGADIAIRSKQAG